MNVQVDLSGPIFFLFAGPVTGVIVYYALKRRLKSRYRNFKARYVPERDVARAVTNMVTKDDLVATTTVGTREVMGRNDKTPAVRAAFAKVTKR